MMTRVLLIAVLLLGCITHKRVYYQVRGDTPLELAKRMCIAQAEATAYEAAAMANIGRHGQSSRELRAMIIRQFDGCMAKEGWTYRMEPLR